MALAKRNEGAKVNSDINVTPMVDVMLVLLIIFMVVTPMLQHGVTVDMARVNNPEQMPDADKEDALLIAVMRDGKVFFGTDPISVDDLTQKIRDRLANRTDKRVFIKADARAKFGSVVQVVDNVRSAGVDQLGLLTDQKKSGALRPASRDTHRRAIEEISYGNGNWRLRRGSNLEHERHAAHRRVAGAADHLHGDHAPDAQGSGRPGAAATTAQSESAATDAGPHHRGAIDRPRCLVRPPASRSIRTRPRGRICRGV